MVLQYTIPMCGRSTEKAAWGEGGLGGLGGGSPGRVGNGQLLERHSWGGYPHTLGETLGEGGSGGGLGVGEGVWITRITS